MMYYNYADGIVSTQRAAISQAAHWGRAGWRPSMASAEQDILIIEINTLNAPTVSVIWYVMRDNTQAIMMISDLLAKVTNGDLSMLEAEGYLSTLGFDATWISLV